MALRITASTPEAGTDATEAVRKITCLATLRPICLQTERAGTTLVWTTNQSEQSPQLTRLDDLTNALAQLLHDARIAEAPLVITTISNERVVLASAERWPIFHVRDTRAP